MKSTMIVRLELAEVECSSDRDTKLIKQPVGDVDVNHLLPYGLAQNSSSAELMFTMPSKMLGIRPQIWIGWQSDLQAMEVSQQLLVKSVFIKCRVSDDDMVVIV